MYRYRELTPEQKKEALGFRELRGFPLHAPPHLESETGWYLVTAAIYEHKKVFVSEDSRAGLLHYFTAEFTPREIRCAALVVLPNHYHFLLFHPSKDEITESIRLVHGRTSKRMNDARGKRGRQNWCNFSNRSIRGERHYWATVNYIHYDPVKHGYCKRMSEWACSSVHTYFEENGIEWLQELWREYPLRDYGKGWDW